MGDMNYTCAAAIGAVSGLRSLSGPAILAEAANRNLVKLGNTPLAWLGTGSAARTSAILAVGELIADKLPFIPSRTKAGPLAVRAISGAMCGYAVCGKGQSKTAHWMSALVGASAALAAAWAGNAYRRHVHLPPILAALAEDAVAVGSGALVVSAIGR